MRADSGLRRRDRAGERGQTFPFVVVLLFALFIIAGLVINVGQAVNRRIFLQIAADAGAYTGASEMARGMNTLAKLNGDIQKAWGGMTTATAGFTITPCIASDIGVAGYASVQGAATTLMTLVNKGYGARARSEAERVTTYNALDLFPNEQLEMGESDSSSGLQSPRPKGRVVEMMEVPPGTSPVFPALSPARKMAAWTCVTGIIPQPRSAMFGLWYQKAPGSPVAFVWVVKAPATRARVFDTFFGPTLIPKMTAVAAAKPVGGEIKLARQEYITKLIPVRDLGGSVWDWRNRIRRYLQH
jgi:hypothetical protein